MKAKGVIQIVSGAALFGLIPFFVRYAPQLSIASIAFGRAAFAALFAFCLLLVKDKSLKDLFSLKIGELFHLFNWTLFLALAIVFYFLAINKGSVAVAGVLMGMHPVFVVLFSIILFKEKIHKATWLACFIAVVGGGLIALAVKGSNSATLEGALYAIASGFFLGLNFTYHLKFLTRFSSERLVFYQNFFQIPLLLFFVFDDPGTLSQSGWVSMAFLGVICTGLAYLLVYSGSKYVDKQSIGVLQMIENIIPIILGLALYGETMGIYEIVGIILIIISSLLAGKSEKEVEEYPTT